MGKARIPGPYRRATLSMRSPSLKVEVDAVVDTGLPMMVRLNSRKLVIGYGSDVNVYEPDDRADTDKDTPISQRLTRDIVGRRLIYKLEKPVVSLDLESGILTGTAVLSIPNSDAPEYRKSPLEIPVQITIKLPQSAQDLTNLHAHIEGCLLGRPRSSQRVLADLPGHGVCVNATVELRYDQALLGKVIREVKDVASNANNLPQVAMDVKDLVTHLVPELAKSLLIKASVHAPLTSFDLTASPFEKYLDYHVTGFNLIPKGAIFDFSVPEWGYTRRGHFEFFGRHITWSGTAGLLAYPSLPAIMGGEHWTSMFPAYGYGELAGVTHVSKGLDLGVRLTVALDAWTLTKLKPSPAPETLMQEMMDMRYPKYSNNPLDNDRPFVMFQIEGRFDWPGSK